MSLSHSTLSLAIFAVFTATAYAEDDSLALSDQPAEKKAVSLNAIVIEAEKATDVGTTVYSKEDLDRIPNSSKNITDLLKVNPNVQFGNDFRSGMQQGDLDPADISINGGLPYDNKILINGVSVNNTLNPVGANSSNSPNEILGGSQAAAINADLICNLKVLDSNVGAEYGEFTGGVVSAETCAPNTEIGKLHGSISYDYTTDAWAKVNFPNQQEQDEFEDSTSEDNQPFFTKQGISINTYAKLSESFGFNAFGSYRHSAIPLLTESLDPGKFEQKREAINGGLELFYTPSDRTSLKIGMQAFENKGLYFQSSVKDSQSNQESNSHSFYINLKNELDHVSINQQLNYQTQQGSRTSNQDTYSWKTSENKNWGNNSTSSEGNFGNLDQEENRLEYSIKALFDTVEFGGLKHTFNVGAGYGHYDAYWKRPEQTNVYATAKNLNGAGCIASDGSAQEACDDSLTLTGNYTGQFLSAKTTYEQGQIDIRQDRWHVFAEDTIQWNKYLAATLGVRSDYDSINKNNNVAPRTSLAFKPFGNEKLKFTTGWNRYYGLNAFVNELNDRVDQFEHKYNRTDVDAEWNETTTSKRAHTYRSDLKTPYTDETLFAINSSIKNVNLGLKWLNRDNQDQLRKSPMDLTTLGTTYDNAGHSESDIYTLSISNIQPFQFAGIQHRLSFNADYTETTRNFDSYNTTVILTATPQIRYNGKIMDAEDKPANEFNVPWTLRLNWDMNFNAIPLTISNFLSYEGKVDAMKKVAKGYTDAEGVKYDDYTPYTTNNKFYWDLKAAYTLPTFKDTKTIFGLTINNVTNRANSYINSEGVAKPEIGRQFIADVTFKF